MQRKKIIQVLIKFSKDSGKHIYFKAKESFNNIHCSKKREKRNE